MNWFEKITGFTETSYEATQARLRVEDGHLRSDATDKRYSVGRLEVPSLAELRERVSVASLPRGRGMRLSCVEGDARALHSERVNRGALFQVASQFNLLEMVGPDISPEHGVTRYMYDRTQGPACAIAAGAGTIFRNYFVDMDGEIGQRASRQIDCLVDIGAALGNQHGSLWQMRNGYVLCSDQGLAEVDARFAAMDESDLDAVRGKLRIGVHTGVQVTDSADPGQRVSQAYCSALPVAYSRLPRHLWERFARLILEATYEATLLAGFLNFSTTGSDRVLLTRVGGGAFGNDLGWINDAIRRAVKICGSAELDVRIVSFGAVPRDLRELVRSLQTDL